jgi:hypothetical protein
MEIIKKGDKYNRLTAIKFDYRNKQSRQFWLFKCSCGNKKVIRVDRVKTGNTKSCGCLNFEPTRIIHGMSCTNTYRSWADMKSRCLNKNHKKYKYWGGRGITICKEWLGKNGFQNFYKDMGNKPKNKSLDRIDNNGNYCKENCRWVTIEKQNNNRRKYNETI